MAASWALNTTTSTSTSTSVYYYLSYYIYYYFYVCYYLSYYLYYYVYVYRQVSDIRRTKSQHLTNSRTVLRLSLPNPLKPDVKSRMKMQLEQRRQAMLQLHLSDRQIYCLLGCVLY